MIVVEQPLDHQVRRQLKKWPQRPPGLTANTKQPGTWLKARPGDAQVSGGHPFLKVPGSDRLRTLPDGLWLHFSPKPTDPYVDILSVEACGSLPNLLDKRSRFAPSISSLLAVCPMQWLLSPAQNNDPTPRWRLIRLLKSEPTAPIMLPVRDSRVLFALQRRHYDRFAASHIAHPHELFCPMEALVAEHGHESPAMQALLHRGSAGANFLHLP
jgi:hypothetical protein